MTSILLIISFLLHLILLAVVYSLSQQIQELKAERSRETEQLLSRFLDEIKQENRQLQKQMNTSHVVEPKAKTYDTDEHTRAVYTQDSKKNEKPKFKVDHPQESFSPPISPEKQDKVETSSESRIFQLYQEGLPLDEIAKKVNRGKTEVELLIKLHQPL